MNSGQAGRVGAIAFVILLSGCAIPPSPLPARPPGELFRGVEAPPPGSARVYIFRPGFSTVSAQDSPRVLIDGKEVARLSVETYTDVTFKPGVYSLTLEPNPQESSVWSGTWQMRTQADQVYFLAVWNDVAYSTYEVWVPRWSPSPTGSLLFSLFLQPSSQGSHIRDASLHFEPVSPSDALPVISTFTYRPPLLKAFEHKLP